MFNWGFDVQNIISILATVGALSIGISGLNTWKKQLKGNANYKLSRRILVGLLAYKEIIKNVRNSVIFHHEIPDPPDGKKENMSKEQQHFYGIAKVYNKRWNKVRKQRNKLYPDELEAEALWEKDVNRFFKALYKLEHELVIQVQHHLGNL